VLGYVGDPETIGFVSGEGALDQIRSGGYVRDSPQARPAGQTVQACSVHEHLDGVVTDGDAVAENQFSVYPASTVNASRVGMHLEDQVREPVVADGPLAGRPVAPHVETRDRHAEHSASHLHG
jgi:hypothetical protein